MTEEDFKEGFMKFWNSAVYFIFDIVSFDISSNCRHFNGSPLLCPITPLLRFHMYLDYIIQEYFIVE
jgi:hypothetical protein